MWWTGHKDGVKLQMDISYTGHRKLEAAKGLIHIKGRVDDSTIGRFLYADPCIQEASNSQSYNRYSYVSNNPLSYTDPTGYQSTKDPGECA